MTCSLALRKQFRPDDASEQAIAHWSNLRQTKDVTSYMDEVDKLHLSHPLCEVAEFGLARAGLTKRDSEASIKRALADQDREWLTLKELRDLARSAEIEKCDPSIHKRRKKAYTPCACYSRRRMRGVTCQTTSG